jgi:hypothetical protein
LQRGANLAKPRPTHAADAKDPAALPPGLNATTCPTISAASELQYFDRQLSRRQIPGAANVGVQTLRACSSVADAAIAPTQTLRE